MGGKDLLLQIRVGIESTEKATGEQKNRPGGLLLISISPRPP
jgi:hypothetical protein